MFYRIGFYFNVCFNVIYIYVGNRIFNSYFSLSFLSLTQICLCSDLDNRCASKWEYFTFWIHTLLLILMSVFVQRAAGSFRIWSLLMSKWILVETISQQQRALCLGYLSMMSSRPKRRSMSRPDHMEGTVTHTHLT